MASIKDLYQSADWKKEKHVPVIEAPGKVKKGQIIQITVSVGKEIAHPNTTEHHIAWIEVYFKPQDDKFPYQLGRFEFTAHGSSTQGPNTSTVYTEPKVVINFKSDKPGVIIASSYCNIHGLWESNQELSIE
ncbi:MAG: class II SORL domain-containing protein [Candidatus Omnitrophica bacterium]|jgi:superoxide reductase|nr:class II SORL domain-containing protein [Candidatus Omnitrophota bacterium]